jgi:hypothetical protein
MTIPSKQLIQELKLAGFKKVHDARDGNYFLPSKKWVRRFAKWFVRDLPVYSPESYDCDDFALRALDRANDALHDSDQAVNCGHSFGYADITISFRGDFFGIKGPQRHACNIVRTRKQWFYFEPQLGRIMSFDEMDKRNALARRNFALL